MSGPYAVEDLRQKYDEIAPRYDQLERLTSLLGVRRLRRALFSKARGEVLEVAAGTGKNLEYYPPECRITAVDISEGMLELARKRAAALGRDVTFKIMDAESLDFPANRFDTVTSSLSVCTFPNAVAALQEMGRVCRPDGRILLLEHGRSQAGLVGRLQDMTAERHSRAYGCFWNREPQHLAQLAGLRIITAHRSVLGIFHAIEAAPDA